MHEKAMPVITPQNVKVETISTLVRRHYPGLDGLRALAVVIVFFCHYNPAPHNAVVSAIVSQGWAGVQFFFVLSGFLITGILWDSRNQPHKFRDFYARRVLRIFPLYYGVWLALLCFQPLMHWQWNWRWLLYIGHLGNYGRYLFYNPANVVWLETLFSTSHRVPAVYLSHLWSLCVEEQFYLIWPMLVYACSTREKLRSLCVGTMAFSIGLRIVLLHFVPTYILNLDLNYRITPTQMDALAMGGLLATLIRGPEGEFLRRHNGLISATLASFALIYWTWAGLTFGIYLPGGAVPIFSYCGLLVVDLLGLGLLLRAIHPGSALERAFAWRPIAYFGTITYGFYVLHDIPHLLYRNLAWHIMHGQHWPALTALVGFGATLILASLSFRYFEKPISSLKRYFSHQVHEAPAA